MEYEVVYLNYEGNVRSIGVEADSEDEAIENAYNEETNYSGDNIHKIIEVTSG